MAEEIGAKGPSDTAFFGHPRGLATLFFTEFWERFSYYGLRPLLVLFMTAAASEGGFGADAGTASNVYAIYAATVYLLSLPGGWLADRFLGQRRAVLYGGMLIALGNFLLVIHSAPMFFLGLGVITIGTGLLKPNVSTIVGQLYRPGDARRDGGFSIFYMGINLGALLAPIACGYVGERIDWHYGFALAGIGMTLGTIQYWRGGRHLGDAGLHPTPAEDAEKQRRLLNRFLLWAGGAVALIGALIVLYITGALPLTVEMLANGFGGVLTLVVVGVFGWLLFGSGWTAAERRRLWVVAGLFAASTIFFSVFEQAPTTLNLFARDITDRNVSGFEVPVSWFQTLNPLFIIALAPVFAWLWARLGSRDPSSQAKFVFGLIGASLGFVILIWPAARFESGHLASPVWLVLTYLFHTCGELCLSPVGLSAMTKLAPARVGGFLMGVFFLSISVGNYMGGRVASFYEAFSLPLLIGTVAAVGFVAALILAVFVKPMNRLTS